MARNTKTYRETSIVAGYLYFEDVQQCQIGTELFTEMLTDRHLTTIRLVSLGTSWIVNDWVTYDTKVTSELDFEMTLRKEVRRGRDYWYAYRRVLGTLHKRYVGDSESVTARRLFDVARAMPCMPKTVKQGGA